jgi:hypothetical protein
VLIFFSFDSFCVYYVVGIELVCGDKMHLATAASVLHFTLDGYGDAENVFILKKTCSISCSCFSVDCGMYMSFSTDTFIGNIANSKP